MNDKQEKIIDALSRYVKEDAHNYFVVDIKHVEDRIIVTYLDGHTTEEEYTEHNYNNYYRYRMTNQIRNIIIPNLSAQIEAINSQIINANLWIGTSLIGMFLSYGLDANEFFKIFFATALTCSLLSKLLSDKRIIKKTREDAVTLLPLVTYGMDDSVFEFVDPETRIRDSLINVEDVYNGKHTVESLLGIALFASFVPDEDKKRLKDSDVEIIDREDGTKIIQISGEDFGFSKLIDKRTESEEKTMNLSK